MLKASRREFVVSAATAGAILGLERPLAFITPAHAQTAADVTAKGFHTSRSAASR